jgi:hypothetical protein
MELIRDSVPTRIREANATLPRITTAPQNQKAVAGSNGVRENSSAAAASGTMVRSKVGVMASSRWPAL